MKVAYLSVNRRRNRHLSSILRREIFFQLNMYDKSTSTMIYILFLTHISKVTATVNNTYLGLTGLSSLFMFFVSVKDDNMVGILK